jgi:hypothetical protein
MRTECIPYDLAFENLRESFNTYIESYLKMEDENYSFDLREEKIFIKSRRIVKIINKFPKGRLRASMVSLYRADKDRIDNYSGIESAFLSKLREALDQYKNFLKRVNNDYYIDDDIYTIFNLQPILTLDNDDGEVGDFELDYYDEEIDVVEPDFEFDCEVKSLSEASIAEDFNEQPEEVQAAIIIPPKITKKKKIDWSASASTSFSFGFQTKVEESISIDTTIDIEAESDYETASQGSEEERFLDAFDFFFDDIKEFLFR